MLFRTFLGHVERRALNHVIKAHAFDIPLSTVKDVYGYFSPSYLICYPRCWMEMTKKPTGSRQPQRKQSSSSDRGRGRQREVEEDGEDAVDGAEEEVTSVADNKHSFTDVIGTVVRFREVVVQARWGPFIYFNLCSIYYFRFYTFKA